MAKKDTGFEYEPFSYKTYTESTSVKQAKDALNAQLAEKPGAYQSQWQTQLNDTINKIMNRDKFSYDLNGDALYQQYKDKYIQQGKMAMQDTMGQAAAMTGGYGNSYAQSVGQQAYQASLQNLNDIVPELYQMAYDKYNQEGQDLYNQYSLLGTQEEMDYGRYRDTVSDYLTERDYLTGRYDTERGFDYTKYNNDRDFTYGLYADAKNYAYTDHRNAIADEQWNSEYQLALDKFDLDKAQIGASKDSSGNYVVPSTPVTLTAKEYNEVLTNAAGYAKEGKAQLKTYLNALLSRGLTKDEIADIYEMYFPTTIPEVKKGAGRANTTAELY